MRFYRRFVEWGKGRASSIPHIPSFVRLMGLNLDIPEYSTLSKRSINLELSTLAYTLKPGSYLMIDSTGLIYSTTHFAPVKNTDV